jgi:transposase InsO family protein
MPWSGAIACSPPAAPAVVGGPEDLGPAGQNPAKERGAGRADGRACRAKKKSWPDLNGRWTAREHRDEVIDFIVRWVHKTQLPASRFIGWLGISSSKFHDWKNRQGRANVHNALMPRDHWLDDWEKAAILNFEFEHPLEGYRRLAFMMLDADVVAVSPSSVYRVLKQAGRIGAFNGSPSKKGTGFQQPLAPHEHWHVDISYINISGTFYYLATLLDGMSRAVIHFEIHESMTEPRIELLLQRAREKYPPARPRIISDNGPQFIANDFKQFIPLCGMTHVRTSPFYPQSNGKLERFHKTIKSECIRPKTPLNLDDARRITGQYVSHYNNIRLHSAIGYIAPADKLAGRDQDIFQQRGRKLAQARAARGKCMQAPGVAQETTLDAPAAGGHPVESSAEACNAAGPGE